MTQNDAWKKRRFTGSVKNAASASPNYGTYPAFRKAKLLFMKKNNIGSIGFLGASPQILWVGFAEVWGSACFSELTVFASFSKKNTTRLKRKSLSRFLLRSRTTLLPLFLEKEEHCLTSLSFCVSIKTYQFGLAQCIPHGCDNMYVRFKNTARLRSVSYLYGIYRLR
jgi:hypothetical protein